jgi:protein TonB
MSDAPARRLPTSVAAFVLERPEPEVGPGDRFSFSIFLAATLHVAVILGVGFTVADRPETLRTLEVTLAQFRSETAPEDADFLAQADQEGSGTLDEVRELTTDRDAPVQDSRVNDAAEPSPPPGATESRPDARLARDAEASDAEAPQETPTPPTEAREFDSDAALARAMEMASLDARRASEIQIDAEGRRVRRITSVSARSAVEAAYLQSWRRKVETIGNLNYPMEARRRGLEGDLKVLVEIAASGRLIDVRVLESSGSDVLDASALKIVRLAAPFLPFPDDLREQTDVLQIVRTWQFRRRGFGAG